MTKGDFIMKTNFKNEKQIASMIILAALLILSVIMVVNFGKASGGTFEFSNNGNTYTVTFDCINIEKEATNFLIGQLSKRFL